MAKPNVLTMPSDRPVSTRPDCVRVRGVRCRCFECRCYLTEAHVLRGAFCADCCPACRGLRTPAGGGNAA